MRRYFTSGDLLDRRLWCCPARLHPRRRSCRGAAAPGATVFLKREGALGTGTHRQIDDVRGAPARRGGACVDRVPARRRRPPRRLLRAGDHRRRASAGRRRQHPDPRGRRPAPRPRPAATGRTCSRSWPISRRSRPPSPSSPARRVRRPREHDRRRELGRPGEALGGPSVAAYNLGSRNRTLAQDIELIVALPETPGIVYIGINVGRFTAPPTQRHDRPCRSPAAVAAAVHASTSTARAGSSAPPRRRRCSGQWLASATRSSRRTTPPACRRLEKLIAVCKRRRACTRCCSSCRATRRSSGTPLDAPISRYTHELPGAGQEVRRPMGEPRERAATAQRRLLRPLAPRRARAHCVATAPVGRDRRSSSRRTPWTEPRPHDRPLVLDRRRVRRPGLPGDGERAPRHGRARAGAAYPKAFTDHRRCRGVPRRSAQRRTASTACRSSPTCAPRRQRSRSSSCSAARRRARPRSTTPTGPPRSASRAAPPGARLQPRRTSTTPSSSTARSSSSFPKTCRPSSTSASTSGASATRRQTPRVSSARRRSSRRARTTSTSTRWTSASRARRSSASTCKYWLTTRRPEFNAHYAYNIEVLESVVLHLPGPRPAPGAGRPPARPADHPPLVRHAGREVQGRLQAGGGQVPHPLAHVRRPARSRRRRLLRHLPPRRTGPRQVPAPPLARRP